MEWPPFDETKPETWPPTTEAPYGFTSRGNPRKRARPTVKGHSQRTARGKATQAQNEADVRELFPNGANAPRMNVPPPGINDKTLDPDGTFMDKRARQKVVVRMGKRWSEITQRVRAGEFTWEEFCDELSPEELARGQLKDSNGTFSGRPPEFVPKAFHNACMAQIKKRFDETLLQSLQGATDGLVAMLSDPEVDHNIKAKVSIYLIERVMGKVPDKIIVSSTEPWEEAIISGIVSEDAAIANATDYLSRLEVEPNVPE